MSDYLPQNPQPTKRYKRQTPVLHVPTRDEWRKLGQITGAVVGSGTAIATLVFGYKVIHNYLTYTKDIVIQHGLFLLTIYGVLTIASLILALSISLPATARGYFAITKRHRPGYLLSTTGNGFASLALHFGVGFTAFRAIEAIVGLTGRLKDLQTLHHPIAYDVIDLTSADNAADAFSAYTPNINISFIQLVFTVLFLVGVITYFARLTFLTEAQELTPEEHTERQLGLNAIQKYVQDRHYQRIREQAAVLLFMYDHVHPEDWIWQDYHPEHSMRTYHKDEPDEITVAFASSTNFDHYLKAVWKTYVECQDFQSNDSTITIDADDMRYVNVNTGTSVENNGVRYTTVKMSRNCPDNIKQMLEQYIETADKRITDYLDL